MEACNSMCRTMAYPLAHLCLITLGKPALPYSLLACILTDLAVISSAPVCRASCNSGLETGACFSTMLALAQNCQPRFRPLLPLPNSTAGCFSAKSDASWRHPYGTPPNAEPVRTNIVFREEGGGETPKFRRGVIFCLARAYRIAFRSWVMHTGPVCRKSQMRRE